MLHSLNENIKRLRIARGMNQVEFARLIGVTKQCVSNWENDNIVPSVDMLVKIADLFKISTDSLLGRDQRACIDVSSLTSEQVAHIALIVDDYASLNSKQNS